MGTRFTLQQFSEIFQIRKPTGALYVLIGGQAVNYWGERYVGVEPGLKLHIPFTSEHIDFWLASTLFVGESLYTHSTVAPRLGRYD